MRANPNKPDGKRSRINFQPLEEFPAGAPSRALLRSAPARPLHLCPVDLHKLYASAHFDIVERYKELAAFSSEAQFRDETQWLERQIEKLGAGR